MRQPGGIYDLPDGSRDGQTCGVQQGELGKNARIQLYSGLPARAGF